MKRIAFIFPGQGAQYTGMGKEFFDIYPVSRQIYEEAGDILGYKISDICFNGSEEDLMITENTQPAILTTSVAILKVLNQKGFTCDYTAGLSLGEYSALVNAKSIEFADALKVVRNRGIYMQQAVPSDVGRMGAIVGLSEKEIENIIEQSKKYGLIQIANFNTYEQIVLSGEKKTVSFALKKAKEIGAKKALPLPVSAPFHCDLLVSAGCLLSKDLETVSFNNPKIPFISNVSGKIIYGKEKIKQHLIKQVSSSVLWRQSIELLLNKGVKIFIEIGPGTTLSNFVKSIAKHNKINIISESINSNEELVNVIRILETNRDEKGED